MSDVQEETQIIVSPFEEQALAELIQKAGNPEEALNELGLHFELLHQGSEPKQQQLLENAWHLVGKVYNAVGVSFALLVGAREIVAELESQNTALIDEYERVRLGMEDPDYTDHPLVKALVEKVRDWEGEAAAERYEMMFEDWKLDEFDRLAEDAQDYADESIRDEVDDEIAEVLDISSYEARDVVDLLMGQKGKLTDEECREFLDWCNRVEDRLIKERMARKAS